MFNFELEENLDQYFEVKFNGEFGVDSLKAQKPYKGPLYGPY